MHWGEVAYIVISWIISPLFSGLAAFVLIKIIDKTILSRMDTAQGALKTSPVLVAATVFIMSLSLFLETPLGHKLGIQGIEVVVIPCAAAVLGYLVCFCTLRAMIRQGQVGVAEEIFRYLQVMTSCYVSFGNGANDVANAMGPLAGIYFIYSTGSVAEHAPYL